jgi:2-phospho-L-lactate/phosphoenolpyruvate guanylyltransferase
MKTPIALDPDSAGSVMARPSDTSSERSAGTGPWALVPVKGFCDAKRRLAAVLSAGERADLAEAMLRHVLQTLAAVPEVAGILLVTDDPRPADVARQFGADVLEDRFGSGTNAAVMQGLDALTLRRRAAALVVPGDIPLMTPDELREVLARGRDCPAVLVPASRDGGTNLMLVRPPELLNPAFGPDSFSRHVAAARALGIEPCVMRLEGIGLDIDTPEDLETLAAHAGAIAAR